MFRKLLNVGKGHSIDKLQLEQTLSQQNNQQLSQNQLQTLLNQQQVKNQFSLNEIKSYGFSHLTCLGHSQSLSLLAVGSKHGLLRIFGNPSVEFSYQLTSGASFRQLEFLDCRPVEKQQATNKSKNGKHDKDSGTDAITKQHEDSDDVICSAKILALTDDGYLHLFELTTSKQLDFADNTTQTEAIPVGDCCQQKSTSNKSQSKQQNSHTDEAKDPIRKCTKLFYCGFVDYFKVDLDNQEDRSKRVTTFEISPDRETLLVGTESGKVYLVPLNSFLHQQQQNSDSEQVQKQNQNNSLEPARSQSQLSNSKTVGITSTHATNKQNATSNKLDNKTSESPETNGIQNDKKLNSIIHNNNNIIENNDHVVDDDDDKKIDISLIDGDVEKLTIDDDVAIEKVDIELNEGVMQSKVIVEPFDIIRYEDHVAPYIDDEMIKNKKQGAIESIKRHPNDISKILISYHRGLSAIYDLKNSKICKYFYHNQVLESSCFADQNGDYFYTSHNDGSYIKWDCRPQSASSQPKPNEDFLTQLHGPYPCKPTPKIQACTGFYQPNQDNIKDSYFEQLVIFSGGMPRATFDDKNPVTIVRQSSSTSSKDSIKIVLDFTSKVLDFVVITRPRCNLALGGKSLGQNSSSGGGKKGKNRNQNNSNQQQMQQQQPIAVALAILAEEEFVVIDLLQSGDSYLEFPLPYLNCIHSSAITSSQHYANVSNKLYQQLVHFNKLQSGSKLSQNEWPINGGKTYLLNENTTLQPNKTLNANNNYKDVTRKNILITGHEDGSVNIWDVSELSMNHLVYVKTSKFFSINDDDDDEDEAANNDALNTSDESTTQGNNKSNGHNDENNDDSAWPPIKRVGKFDPYSDDARLAIRKLGFCPKIGTLVLAGTGGQVLVLELGDSQADLAAGQPVAATEIAIVDDHRFVWKGHDKLKAKTKSRVHQAPGYQLASYAQLQPPVAPTSLDLKSSWSLYAIGTSYGFALFDYVKNSVVVSKCLLNPHDFALIGGDSTGAISRKKSFRKSLRESFRRLRRSRSQRHQPKYSAPSGAQRTTGVRSLAAANAAAAAANTGGSNAAAAAAGGICISANFYAAERQVEPKVELSSIVKCINLTYSLISAAQPLQMRPSLWVGTNSGQVLVYAISLSSPVSPAPQPASAQDLPSDRSAATADTATASAGDDATTVASNVLNISASSATSATAPQVQVEATTARLAKEIQLKHKAPVIGIFTTPEAPYCDQHENEQQDQQDNSRRESSTSSSDQQVSTSLDGPSPSAEHSATLDQHGLSFALEPQQQARVLICSEEQFKVFNLPSLKPFGKFKLTAHEGSRARKVCMANFPRLPAAMVTPLKALKSSKSVSTFATQTSRSSSPAPPVTAPNVASEKIASESNNNSVTAPNNNNQLMEAKFGAKASTGVVTSQSFIETATANNIGGDQPKQSDEDDREPVMEPFMVCLSNQGDCAVYSVPDLKKITQVQVCKREDVNGIASAMLTNYGEGFYLKSSSNFQRFAISSHKVPKFVSSL